MDSLDVVIFGDGTSNVSTLLHKLMLRVSQSAAQSEFIQNAGAALTTQAQLLHPGQRQSLPPFRNIHDLVGIYQESNGVCHPAIGSALLCITQLLQVFHCYEEHVHSREHDTNVTVAGLCTGSLAAAAYAASSSVHDLKLLAVPTTAIAFQMGLEAAVASSVLHEQREQLLSWSLVVPKWTESEALSRLQVDNSKDDLSLHQQCFLSAVGLSSATISGPPLALDRFETNLRASEPSRKTTRIPIFAGYHAPHIHKTLDFGSFLSRCLISEETLTGFKPAKKLLSPLTGEPVESTSALSLFRAVVIDTLRAPLRLDRIVDSCLRLIQEHGSPISAVNIHVVEPTPVPDGLVTALLNRTTSTIHVQSLVEVDSKTDECRQSRPPSDQVQLAIVGMSGRFPGANSVEALWGVLEAGLDLHRVIPKDRFDVDAHVDLTGKAKNTSWTPYGCFIDRPGEFDPRFFNMSPREALQTDPMQRLALVTAYEALEMSGFVPDRTPSTTLSRVGTFYGQTSDDYRDVNAAQEIETYFITGGIRAFGPGRINYFFKFGGPSFNIDTACSSGLAAIQMACKFLWSGECDMAVAGGLSVLTSPDLYSGLSRGQFLSRTGSCKTFDDGADGYCRADGVGSIVIKRLSDAVADRDNVLGVIRAIATNHSANAISLTHPHAKSQSTLYRDVLNRAGVDSLDVNYIEMHGTGTQAGDAVEMRSVMDVFAPQDASRADDNPLHVGSLKSNIGHGEASAGVSSLIKALLVLQKETIPPHVGIKTQLNRGFPDLKARNIRIPLENVPFPKKNKKRAILVNNFGAAGGNTALLLQEAPRLSIQQDVPLRPVHPVTVSGHTQSAFRNNLERLIAYLAANPQISPADLSYTATARRRHHYFRATVAKSSIQATRAALEQKLQTDPVDPNPHDPVFVFTGQGAAYPALAYELYMTSTQFRADIDRFNEITTQHQFPPIVSLVNGRALDLDELSPTQVQVGLVCVQIALARLWASWGIKPAAVIGHSLGEYAALQVCGVLSVSDTIYLVGSRAQQLESRCTKDSHAMLAVGDSAILHILHTVPHGLAEQVEIACVNSPQETVIAGPINVIDELAGVCQSSKIRFKKLLLPYAFHSAQVDPILDDFESLASQVIMQAPRIPILSSLKGRVLGTDGPINPQYLREHCRQPVQFADALRHAQQTQVVLASTVFVEIGPHPICSAMVRQVLGNQQQTLPTLRRNDSPWSVMASSLSSLHDLGASVNWAEYHRDLEQGCCLLSLPAYAFDSKNYWIDYMNDWTLRKGDPAPAVNNSTPVRADRLSASVHRVVEEQYNGPDPMAVFETDLGAAEVHTAIRGHCVNNSGLCPASLYADMALTIGCYIQRLPESGLSLSGCNLTGMEVHQGLIVNSLVEEETRVLRVHAHLHYSSQTIKLEYFSVDDTQKSPISHATCVISFEDSEKWLRRWRHDLHLIQDRITSLQSMVNSGRINKLTTGLAYRLFSSLVEYAPEYQRMDQVLFDGPHLEACANVKLDDRGVDSTFLYSPYWLDSLMHITGFVMNSNDTLNHRETVYIAHGWEALRIVGPLLSNRNYQSYVKMFPESKNTAAGNVWILCDGKIVGLVENVQFQRVPRTVLDLLLSPTGTKLSVPKPAVTTPRNLQATVSKPHHNSRQKRQSEADLSGRRVFGVILTELGVASSEVSMDDQLGNLGVDSLMALRLTGKILDIFGINMPHSEIMKCGTAGQLLDLLNQQLGSPEQRCETQLPASYDTAASSQSDGDDILTPDGKGDDMVERLKVIIIEETGIPPEDLSPSADLIQFGVDSLMSLVILGRLRDEGVELPNNLFHDHHTMNDVAKAISGDRPRSSHYPGRKVPRASPTRQECLESQLILLQRRANPSTDQNLFLFPDGSGSPGFYSMLEPVSPEFDVYGVVSPFVNSPNSYTCSFEGLVLLYLTAVRKHQPHGAYHFGGNSMGGMFAYEAARQMLDVGEEVASLLLMDSPCPVILPPMSPPLIKYCDSIGLYGYDRNKTEEQQRTSMESYYRSVEKLAAYKPLPIPSTAKGLQTLIIWAEHGARDPMKDPEPNFSYNKGDYRSIERWILDDRTEFGPYGWDTLLPVDNMEIKRTPGNHFNFDESPYGSTFCGYLREFMSRFASPL